MKVVMKLRHQFDPENPIHALALLGLTKMAEDISEATATMNTARELLFGALKSKQHTAHENAQPTVRKKLHWTQTVKGKAKMAAAQKKAWRTRRLRAQQ